MPSETQANHDEATMAPIAATSSLPWPGPQRVSCPTTRARRSSAALRAGRSPRRRRPSSRSARGAASRPSTWAPRPRPPAPSCSASTTTTAPRRTRPDGSTTTPGLVDPATGRIDTLPHLAPHGRRGRARGDRRRPGGRLADRRRALEHAVRPAASSTGDTATSRRGPTTGAGRRTWPLGGRLAIHDVFPDPADGGRPPFELWCRPSTQASSPRTANAAHCGCSSGWRPPG